MPPRSKPAQRGALLFALALSLAQASCGGPATITNNHPKTSAEGPIKPVDVNDDDFAKSLAEVLRDGSRSPERLGLLAGVVRRQLAHADKRFVLGDAERATSSVIGALYLLRVNEGQGAMIDEAGARALDGAIKHLSGRGDEGRVLALMEMRAAALGKGQTNAELADHRTNLEQWLRDTHAGTQGQKLGAEARYLVARAMVDPSEETLTKAADSVEAWVARGIEINRIFRATGKRPERAEGMEAARSIETGAMTLAALYARHGDASSALARIEATELRLVTEPALRRALSAAADDGDARAWQMLAVLFAREGSPTEGDEEEREERVSPMLVDAGFWGSVIEAYRKDPTNFETAVMVAQSLTKYGLSEGAPVILANAVTTNSNPHLLSVALRIVFEAMASDAEAGDADGVHRTFRAAGPLLALADRPEMLAMSLEPKPSRLRLLMASVETRTGDLPAARPLYVAAAKADPSVSAWVEVARADRQAGDRDSALANLRLALSAPDARSSLADVAEANLVAFEVYRDGNRLDEARSSLEAALAAALDARKQRGDAGTRARAEAVLGRVLDAFGDAKSARRAHDRALSIASSDRQALGSTVLSLVSRALVRRDLELARLALHEGLEADIGQEERIYGGLWLLLLEREMRLATSEDTTRALMISGDRDAWVVKLATWASGKMSDEALFSAAQSASQKVEAEFYTAMSKRASGDAGATSRLKGVAESPVLDLVEIQMARDLIAPPFRADVPKGVVLP